MSRLSLQLLGPLSATFENGEPVALAYDKVRALLAYLAVEHDRAQPRTRLAGLLWPEKPESAARHSLSQALSSLRMSIGDEVLIVERQTVQFNVESGCRVDLLDFRQLIQDANTGASAPASFWRLQEAVGLYRGPFLEGLSLDDCPEFEDWLRSVQESTRRTFASTLQALIDQLEKRRDLNHACDVAQRLIDLDPWDESSHRLTMRLLAASGRRTAAIKQFELCAAMLDRDLGLEPEPETVELAGRIKAGLEGPIHVESNAYSPAAPAPQALPAPGSPIVGREKEIAWILQELRDSDHRLVTLVGPGGIGKTRLALEVARSLESEVPDGVYFVAFAGIHSAEMVASSILDAISAQVDPHGDPGEQLRAFVAPRRILLVLDNFEHLLDGATLLSDLLESAPGLQLLVTSRERLALTSESVFEVEGLSLPEHFDSPSIATSGAARLFMLRARKHKASFLPRAEDGPAIARTMHLTGGMPLAIELAAAWIPVLSPEEIANEIEQSLDFLSASMRDLPERHQSVRAVIGRSWENLTDVEQRAFRRLSVFQDGFTRAAASFVTGASLPVLSALVSKSLLRHSQAGRYEIHGLLRQFAAERLAEDQAEASVVYDRCRDYFIGFLAVREEQLQGRAQALVLPEIASEIENIRAAWNRAVETADYPGLSRVAHSFWLYYEIVGRYREGVAVMSQALESLLTVQDEKELQDPEYRIALARVRSRWASLGFRMHGSAVMQAEVGQALEMIREFDHPAETGLLLNYLAAASHAFGDLESEERYLIESIEELERAGYRWGLAYSKNDLGHIRALRGDPEGARALHQEALAILEELGDSRGIAFALRNLGIVARQLGDAELALQLLRRSVDVRRPIGNQWGIADSLNQIGVLLRDSGDLDAAADHFREALQIAREIRAMQLAGEILQEYLPLLNTPLRDSAQDRILESREIEQIVSNLDDVSGITVLVDSVLGQDIACSISSSEPVGQ